MIINQTSSRKTVVNTVKFQQLIDRSITEVLAKELDKITSISSHAFQDCKLLKVVYLPANIEAVEASAFSGCSNLTDIYIDQYENKSSLTPSTWDTTATIHWKLVKFNFEFNEDGQSYSFLGHDDWSITDIVIPESCNGLPVTNVANGAYSIGPLTSVVIPASVTNIGSMAFESNDKLESVIFAENSQLKSIGSGVFASCYKISTITIPNSVTSIGSGAFEYCNSLTSIAIGSGVTSIGDYAFGSCDNLTSITIDKPKDSIEGAPWGAPDTAIVHWKDEVESV